MPEHQGIPDRMEVAGLGLAYICGAQVSSQRLMETVHLFSSQTSPLSGALLGRSSLLQSQRQPLMHLLLHWYFFALWWRQPDPVGLAVVKLNPDQNKTRGWSEMCWSCRQKSVNTLLSCNSVFWSIFIQFDSVNWMHRNVFFSASKLWKPSEVFIHLFFSECQVVLPFDAP